jgi:hypothetical protein
MFHSLAYNRNRTIEHRSSISPSVVATILGRELLTELMRENPLDLG